MVHLAPCTIGVHIVIAISLNRTQASELRLHLRHGRAYHFPGHLPTIQLFDRCSGQPAPSFNGFFSKSDAAQYQLLPVITSLGTECTDGNDYFLTDVFAQVYWNRNVIFRGIGSDITHHLSLRIGSSQVYHLHAIIYRSSFVGTVRTDLEGHHVVIFCNQLASEYKGIEYLQVSRILAVLFIVTNAESGSFVLLFPVATEVHRTHVVASPIPVGIAFSVSSATVFVIIPFFCSFQIIKS